jgi:chorismate dehydratase
MAAPMLRLGAVPYANAAPLLEGLGDAPDATLERLVPSDLARRMEEGRLDAALLPSAEVLRRGLVVVPEGGCIASLGEVESVALFSRAPLRAAGAAPLLLLDRSSRTSAALVRILAAGPLGLPGARYGDAGPETDPRTAPAAAVLLIGDPALVLDRRGLEVLDLGDAWTRWTGLPFVWAVWGARDAAAARSAAPLLAAARARGEAGVPSLAAREAARLRLPAARLERYLRDRIRRDLGGEERRGMARFAEELRRLDA